MLRSLGASSAQADPLAGGSVNRTFRVDRAGGAPVVLRFPVDPLREDEFPAEAWAAAAAARAGIPTAEPLGHGVVAGVPYAVSEYVEPDPGPLDRPWTWLGSYARRLGTVGVEGAPHQLFSRFGRDLDVAWQAHLQYNAAALTPDDRLRRDGAYRSADELRAVLAELAGRRFDFGLAHGDLAPRNLVGRGPHRPPVLIDWGAATTGPSPWTDARKVFECAVVDGTVSSDEHDEFTASVGLTSAADRRTLSAMTVLHLVDVARWASDRRPDRYGEYVARCRAGLERLRRW